MRLKSIFFIIFLYCSVIYPIFAQAKPFVIHIARETIALGDKKREQAPNRPAWWPDPEDTKFEVDFDVPFSAQGAELRLEVLNVKSSKDCVKINDATIGDLYPNSGMTFAPSVIIIPVSALNMGKNTLAIESDSGIKEEYDNFLIRNIDLVLYRPGDQPLANSTPVPPDNNQEMVSLPSLIDTLEGEEFNVKVIASPGEGYVWKLQENSYDHKLLRLVSQNQRVFDTQGRVEQEFEFLSLSPGNTQLEFRKFYTATGELAVLDSQASSVQISKLIILTGTLQKIDYPIGQFGTHQLLDDTGNIICILRTDNSEIRLDDYVGLKVKVSGKSDHYDEYNESMGLIFTVKHISVISK